LGEKFSSLSGRLKRPGRQALLAKLLLADLLIIPLSGFKGQSIENEKGQKAPLKTYIESKLF
jgi:hypothetical protein